MAHVKSTTNKEGQSTDTSFYAVRTMIWIHLSCYKAEDIALSIEHLRTGGDAESSLCAVGLAYPGSASSAPSCSFPRVVLSAIVLMVVYDPSVARLDDSAMATLLVSL